MNRGSASVPSWLSTLPAGWEVKRLKRSVAVEKNGIWGGEPTGSIDDIPCIRVADFDRINFVVTHAPTIRSVTQGERTGRLVSDGDLLLEKSGGGDTQPVGAVAMYQNETPAVCSNFIARIPAAADVDARFFLYVHAALYAQRINVRSIKQTSGIQNLDSGAYFFEYAPFPPRDVQTKIARFLDRKTRQSNALIARYESLIGLLDEKRVAVVTSAVSAGIAPGTAMNESNVGWFPAIPQQWSLTRLKYRTAKIGSGITPRGGADSYVSSGVAFLRSQNVYDDGLRLDDVAYISEDVDRMMSRTRLQSNDVLLNITGASIGRTSIVPESVLPANVNQHVCIVRPSSKIRPEFLAYALKSQAVREQILGGENGSSREGLNYQQVGNLWIAVPDSLEEQEQVVSFLDNATRSIDSLKAKVKHAITLLNEHRSALIISAVTGAVAEAAYEPLDVREAIA